MPVLTSTFEPPWYLSNGHAQTVVARGLRRVAKLRYRRLRIDTPDGDFLDLDTLCRGRSRVAILLHGLESSAAAPYIHGMGGILSADGWDVVALNFRGCSGEPNRRLRSYHSGVTDDLQTVIDEVASWPGDASIALVGFSLGGNVVLRYLGERGDAVSPRIRAAAGISVPCDLEGCAGRLATRSNRFYMRRFLNLLFCKVRHRQRAFPGALDYDRVLQSRNFHDFDDRFTAPVHGFDSARHYWASCSAQAVAADIRVPTLLLNAADDPFLTPACHLHEAAGGNRHLDVETPMNGGHVGFLSKGRRGFHQELAVSRFLDAKAGAEES